VVLDTHNVWNLRSFFNRLRDHAYDPAQGRFKQRDPLEYGDGFNLYQYVSGNPNTATDPWGVAQLGLFFEGTGFLSNQSSIISELYDGYVGVKNVDKFIYYPRFGYLLGDTDQFRNIVLEARKRICVALCPSALAGQTEEQAVERFLKNVHEKPIDLFGYSRGAVAALTVANELNDAGCICVYRPLPPRCVIKVRGIPVRFLGVIDPVATGLVTRFPGRTLWTTALPSNVEHYWVGTAAFQRPWYEFLQAWIFSRAEVFKRSNPRRAISSQNYNLRHEDIGASRIVQGHLQAAAESAGVRFN
jgi:hypothetical protein